MFERKCLITPYLLYCPTNEMLADMLTEALSKEKFAGLRKMTGVTEICDRK